MIIHIIIFYVDHLIEQMHVLIAFGIKTKKLEGVLQDSIQFELEEQKHESRSIFKLLV